MNLISSPWCGRLLLGLLIVLPDRGFSQSTAPDAADGSAQQSAYRSSIAEEGVRKQTEKIQAEITELMAELKLNGLDGADLQTLANASSHLQNLSQGDMQKVINALQSASMSSQNQGRQQSLVSAYEEQKDVSLKLKSLAVDLAAQESQKEIPSKLEILIARQSANIRQTSRLTSATTVDQFDAQQKSAHDVAVSEQTSIGGEIDLLFKVLAATPEVAPTAGTPDISKTTLDAMNGGGLKDTAQAAIQLTTAGPFPDAVTKQGAVRDALTAILRVSLSNMDAVGRLEDVKANLNQIVSDQKDLAAVTQESKLDGSVLAERQARIDDRTSVVQALLKPISAAAGSQMGEAQTAMDQSSAALEKTTNPADTLPQQQIVIGDLQKAQGLLDQQIASAQKEETLSPVDKLAQLQQLQAEINQAQKNPQESAADLQKLQQDATTPSPQAANQIADAADQLQKPQPDAAAAQQSLAQANDAVQQQEDALEQSAQAYQALTQASQQLEKAQQEAAAADQAIQNPTGTDLTQAARDLTQAQANVDQAQASQPPPPAGQSPATPQAPDSSQAQNQAQTQPPSQAPNQAQNQDQNQAQNQIPTQPPSGSPTQAQGGLPSAAQQAMQQASDALKDAAMQAVQAQGANAQAQDQKAMAAIQQAQAGLAQAMAQIQQQGQGPGQPQPGEPGQPSQPGPPGQPGQPQQGPSSQATAADAPDQESQLLGGIGTGGVAQVVGGLKAKDRAAISQFQAEKSPPEYAPLVQQYLKNLADSSENH
jgi:hypothetical protein